MKRVYKASIITVCAAVVVLMAAATITYYSIRPTVEESSSSTKQTATLTTFDPNTVSYEQMMAMGFSKTVAISVIKYRKQGKVFEIAEEFALCYGVSDSMFMALRPYIVIGEQFTSRADSLRLRWEQKIYKHTPHPNECFRIDTVSAAYLQTIGFSLRQAEGLIEYREKGAEGIRNMEELMDCWAVSPQMADSLARYVIFPEPKPYGGKVEINSADSLTLVSVPGIGATTAQAIVEYRQLLGGYVSINQLSELKCVTSENFARFSAQICCDSCVFSKIDINFAPASELEVHPYMTREAINKVIKLRKSKGGWKSFEEIVNDNIFTKEQATSLEPYLYFDTTAFDDSEIND